MVRPNRIKNFIFGTGSLTASSAGLFNSYSDHPINGAIQKVEVGANNYTATGSLFLFLSGPSLEKVWSIVSGTSIGNVAQSGAYYPAVYTVDNIGTTGSPLIATQRVADTNLILIGSGVGATKSGTTITVHYI